MSPLTNVCRSYFASPLPYSMTARKVIPLRFSASDPRCLITVYQKQRAEPTIPLYETTFVFTQQTAQNACNLISAFFGFHNESDKKMVRSVFLENHQINCFEFIRTQSPNVILGLRIEENRKLIFDQIKELSYTPMQKTDKLHVSIKTINGNCSFTLDHAAIIKRKGLAASTIALFNNNAFTQVSAYTPKNQFIRTVKRIDE